MLETIGALTIAAVVYAFWVRLGEVRDAAAGLFDEDDGDDDDPDDGERVTRLKAVGE